MAISPIKIILQEIRKIYGKVKANDGISMTIEPGMIHGILGENGAGKSTLMKILSGYIPKTGGTIFVNSHIADYQTPAQASAWGIGMLYQDPLDFPSLSVLDNFMLGQAQGLRMRQEIYHKEFKEIANRFDFDLCPDMLVKHLTVGQRQQLEILRLLALGIQVLILDEPTTGISSVQKEKIFHALRQLASEGKSVILVSHKLEDVEALCNKVTVLRQGMVAGESERPFHTGSLLKMMFSTPPVKPPRPARSFGKVILAMDNVWASGGRTGLKDCSVSIREGEVVGLAGLEGSGQGVFLRVASGIKQPIHGAVRFQDKRMNGKDYHAFKDAGVNFLPGSRLEEGLIAELNIAEHTALRDSKGFWVKWIDAIKKADKRISRFHIKGKPLSAVSSLSGGNQQRLLLSFMPDNPILLLLENPTRGLDLESTLWVWEYLQQYSASGTSIVFSSPEIDEILMVADRVIVFFDGSIIIDRIADDTDVNELGLSIAGKIKDK